MQNSFKPKTINYLGLIRFVVGVHDELQTGNCLVEVQSVLRGLNESRDEKFFSSDPAPTSLRNKKNICILDR